VGHVERGKKHRLPEMLAHIRTVWREDEKGNVCEKVERQVSRMFQSESEVDDEVCVRTLWEEMLVTHPECCKT
jgi:hypothetical protein